MQGDALRHAVRGAAHRPRDVCAVAVAVARPVAVADGRVAGPDAAGELLVRGAQARVEDVGVDPGAGLVVGVGRVERQGPLVDAVEAPGGAALADVELDDPVLLDELDAVVVGEERRLLLGQLEGEAPERFLEEVLEAAFAADLQHLLGDLGDARQGRQLVVVRPNEVRVEDDDVGARDRLGCFLIGPASATTEAATVIITTASRLLAHQQVPHKAGKGYPPSAFLSRADPHSGVRIVTGLTRANSLYRCGLKPQPRVGCRPGGPGSAFSQTRRGARDPSDPRPLFPDSATALYSQ